MGTAILLDSRELGGCRHHEGRKETERSNAILFSGRSLFSSYKRSDRFHTFPKYWKLMYYLIAC
jgi:hypothetical protein